MSTGDVTPSRRIHPDDIPSVESVTPTESASRTSETTPPSLAPHAPTPAIKDTDALEAINRWANDGYFRLRNMGDKVFLGGVKPGAAYAIRVQTHYEQRNVRQVMEPYHGGPVDDRGQPVGKWEIAVKKPRAFEERVDVVPIPYTERVMICGQCAGQRRVSCGICAGTGMMACPMCMGTGVQHVPIMQPGRDMQGNPTTIVQTVTRPCGCARGRVRCSGCSGTGIQTCPTCQGAGQVKTQDQVVVRFQTATEGELLDVTPVPDRWLAKFKGDLVVDKEECIIEEVPHVNPEVDAKIRRLLEESHQVNEDKTRIIRQVVQVDRIPLYEVKYMYAGVDRVLWICGKEQGVHAPNAPWHRGRYWGLIAGAVAAVAAVIGFAMYYLSTR